MKIAISGERLVRALPSKLNSSINYFRPVSVNGTNQYAIINLPYLFILFYFIIIIFFLGGGGVGGREGGGRGGDRGGHLKSRGNSVRMNPSTVE